MTGAAGTISTAAPLATSATVGATGAADPPGATGTSDPPAATTATATSDPPAAATVIAASDPPATSTGSHGNSPTVPIHSGNLAGPQDQAFAPKFLHAAGTTPSASGTTTIVLGGNSQAALIRAGTDNVRNFNLAQGDKLDLTKILAGAPLAHDLANLGNFVKVLGYSQNDSGFGHGTKTSLEVTGPHGSAVVNLEGVGKLELSDLLKHHSLLLPPH